jgi:pimeloyl-ACP methyl ester carboxylesterase
MPEVPFAILGQAPPIRDQQLTVDPTPALPHPRLQQKHSKNMSVKYLGFLKHAPQYILCLIVALAPLHAAGERANPASMQVFQIPSHGALLNALVYVAEGAGPHPAVVLLHGFPGNERNLDLAQEMRRAGWDVLYFNYRGAWGSPGDFSFSHGTEDTAAAVAYLRQPATAKLLRLDPSRIVLIGHSMGGFMAVQGGAADPTIIGVGLISAADLGGRIPQALPKEQEPAVIKGISEALANEGMAPLAGCTPEGLAREVVANGPQWSFVAKADALKSRPALIVTADDGLTVGSVALSAALTKMGNSRVTTLHLPTDHSYSDQRGALAAAVLKWLKTLP